MGRKRKKQVSAKQEPEVRAAITPERFRRLYLLLGQLEAGPQPRAPLLKALSVDIRGFYRDLEFLRSIGIRIHLQKGKYSLEGEVVSARALLPVPDLRLTLAECQQLARGRTRLHTRIQQQIEDWKA
jgi:predicted DNA-binding transcriptional regulator YafY